MRFAVAPHVSHIGDLPGDMNALAGVCSELAARTTRPQGYPFSRVTIYAVPPRDAIIQAVKSDLLLPAVDVEVRSAGNLSAMLSLDFRRAGSLLKGRANEVRDRLRAGAFARVTDGYDIGGLFLPADYVVTAELIPRTDQPGRKTTGCRKFLVEVEADDVPEVWEAILFRKAVKRYVTETLKLNIVPPVFGDNYPNLNPPCVPRVGVTIGDCTERLYQALESHGRAAFAHYPIHLRVPSRREIAARGRWDHRIEYEGGVAWISVSVQE